MPEESTAELNKRQGKITIDLHKWGLTGGTAGALLLALLHQFNPGALLDRDTMRSTVNTAVEERLDTVEGRIEDLSGVAEDAVEKVEAALRDVDRAVGMVDSKVDSEVGHVKESLAQKMKNVSTALSGLRDLIMEKLKNVGTCVADAKEERKVLRARLHAVEAQIRFLENMSGMVITDAPPGEFFEELAIP